jgi:hypothetical protein
MKKNLAKCLMAAALILPSAAYSMEVKLENQNTLDRRDKKTENISSSSRPEDAFDATKVDEKYDVKNGLDSISELNLIEIGLVGCEELSIRVLSLLGKTLQELEKEAGIKKAPYSLATTGVTSYASMKKYFERRNLCVLRILEGILRDLRRLAGGLVELSQGERVLEKIANTGGFSNFYYAVKTLVRTLVFNFQAWEGLYWTRGIVCRSDSGVLLVKDWSEGIHSLTVKGEIKGPYFGDKVYNSVVYDPAKGTYYAYARSGKKTHGPWNHTVVTKFVNKEGKLIQIGKNAEVEFSGSLDFAENLGSVIINGGSAYSVTGGGILVESRDHKKWDPVCELKTADLFGKEIARNPAGDMVVSDWNSIFYIANGKVVWSERKAGNIRKRYQGLAWSESLGVFVIFCEDCMTAVNIRGWEHRIELVKFVRQKRDMWLEGFDNRIACQMLDRGNGSVLVFRGYCLYNLIFRKVAGNEQSDGDGDGMKGTVFVNGVKVSKGVVPKDKLPKDSGVDHLAVNCGLVEKIYVTVSPFGMYAAEYAGRAIITPCRQGYSRFVDGGKADGSMICGTMATYEGSENGSDSEDDDIKCHFFLYNMRMEEDVVKNIWEKLNVEHVVGQKALDMKDRNVI